MATEKKKKRSIGKRIKRTFKKILLSIILFFENLYKKFMSLKDYVRYIIYVWTGIVVLLIILIAISASNNKFKAEYEKYEESLNHAALIYAEKNEIYPLKTNKLKLSMDMLVDYGYLRKDAIADESCVGYAKVYYDNDTDKYTSKAYLNCKKYTTENYKEDK